LLVSSGLLAVLMVFSIASGSVFGQIDFAHEIVPILRKHCAECHTGDSKKGGFSMNNRAALLEGGESGKSVEPGKANESYLLELIQSTDDELRMPPKGDRVSADELRLLKIWIDAGVKWDEGFAFKQPAYEPKLELAEVELPPAIDGRSHPIDRHVLNRSAMLNSSVVLRSI
jgi:Planctomycete cytochrome C